MTLGNKDSGSRQRHRRQAGVLLLMAAVLARTTSRPENRNTTLVFAHTASILYSYMFALNMIVKVFLLSAPVGAVLTRERFFSGVDENVPRHVELVVSAPKHLATVWTCRSLRLVRLIIARVSGVGGAVASEDGRGRLVGSCEVAFIRRKGNVRTCHFELVHAEILQNQYLVWQRYSDQVIRNN